MAGSTIPLTPAVGMSSCSAVCTSAACGARSGCAKTSFILPAVPPAPPPGPPRASSSANPLAAFGAAVATAPAAGFRCRLRLPAASAPPFAARETAAAPPLPLAPAPLARARLPPSLPGMRSRTRCISSGEYSVSRRCVAASLLERASDCASVRGVRGPTRASASRAPLRGTPHRRPPQEQRAQCTRTRTHPAALAKALLRFRHLSLRSTGVRPLVSSKVCFLISAHLPSPKRSTPSTSAVVSCRRHARAPRSITSRGDTARVSQSVRAPVRRTYAPQSQRTGSASARWRMWARGTRVRRTSIDQRWCERLLPPVLVVPLLPLLLPLFPPFPPAAGREPAARALFAWGACGQERVRGPDQSPPAHTSSSAALAQASEELQAREEHGRERAGRARVARVRERLVDQTLNARA